ncbi:class I SAM-dependent methyltransferase [Spongiimicrobium sp. 3-5]|uniref:class I SAM-dependent methyltransferase n=1 Tax=Spongiimicrobium sp. 3-5 TaxID=3332596 RepID=UPI0039814453
MSVLLKKSNFEGVSPKELAEQIEAKKKCADKLPSWFNTPKIYYPNKLNIAQTSSEITAKHKATLIHGKALLDLTGGMGVDSYFFSTKMTSVVHCEIDQNLSEIATHNFTILGVQNVETKNGDGLHILKNTNDKFDWIYVDPSRRNEDKGKVFTLTDSLPNVPENLELLFSKASNILIKTAPLLDISVGLKQLKFVKEIHVVAVKNEVKELLWVLQKGFKGTLAIKTINITKDSSETFNFLDGQEKSALTDYGFPMAYLYEPNSAILKSGAFKIVGQQFKLAKLHQHTHLFTSDRLIGFPGRRFFVQRVLPYNKKTVLGLGLKKANIATRNFPETVATLRKKFKITDGGEVYLFFVTAHQGKLLVLYCAKAL